MVILITGITSGLGKAMAERLNACGHKVYGTCRKDSSRIPGVTYIKADVRDDSSVDDAVNQVISQEGRIDVFINNAGMGIAGPLETTTLENAQMQMDVNFMGMVRFMSRIIPIMRKQCSGHVICVSSIGGLMGLPYQGMYSASKFAIEGYCQALRLEVRNMGIKVTVINPGDFSTAFTAQRNKDLSSVTLDAYPGFARSMEGIENDEHSGLNPDRLARRICRIVTKRHPANRYVVATFIQRASVTLKALLPAKWYDRILSSYYHL